MKTETYIAYAEWMCGVHVAREHARWERYQLRTAARLEAESRRHAAELKRRPGLVRP
jgi:hypothetical protein